MEIKDKIITESRKWHNTILNGDPVMNVLDFCTFITTLFKQNQNWLFRGESHLFDNPMTPSLLRENIADLNRSDPNRNITDLEIKEVEKCQNEVENGVITDKYLKAFLPMMHLDDINWLPLARHFDYKTRLLDVTSNPLVALYFACASLHKGKISTDDDAFVYAFLSGNLRPVNDKNKKQNTSSDFPPIPINYLDLYDVDSQFDVDFNRMPYIFEASIPQQRLVAQSGKFIFWKELAPVLHEKQIIPIRISASEKQIILNELTAFGIDQKSLFPNV